MSACQIVQGVLGRSVGPIEYIRAQGQHPSACAPRDVECASGGGVGVSERLHGRSVMGFAQTVARQLRTRGGC